MAEGCDLIFPCKDEASALPALLALVPEGIGVIVVDNGSIDGTAEVARRCGARVLTEPRLGYGAAVQAGVEACDAEYVAVVDGDGSMDPREVVALLDAVVAGSATMALGRRRPVLPGVWPWHARAGNAVVLWWLRRRTALRVRVASRPRCKSTDVGSSSWAG